MHFHRVREQRGRSIGLGKGGSSKKRSSNKSRVQKEKWSIANNIVRLFGPGAQDLFSTFPASEGAAVTGSVGVALFDMYMHRRKATFLPNDVDIFIAVPFSECSLPLATAYPVITKWIRDVRAMGFHYSLAGGRSVYSNKMCIYDFVCHNEHLRPSLHHPRVSFIIKCASSVRDICNEFDLPICGPILLRTEGRHGRYRMDVTNEIIHMFRRHETSCRFPVLNPSIMNRMIKYHERGFTIVQPDYIINGKEHPQSDFPTLEYYLPRNVKKVAAWFIEELLGRFPTEEEARIYNIDLDRDVQSDDPFASPFFLASDVST